jgi:hypothetical protein
MAIEPAKPAMAPRPMPAQAASTPASGNAWGLGLSLLAVLGLGGVLAATRNRRRDEEDEVLYEPMTEPAAEPAAPVMTGVETPMTSAPLVAEPVRAETPPRVASIATGEASDAATIEEMVAAPPDADNPFKTRKMRRRRARQLLARQEAGVEAEAAEEPVAPGFDWRTYQPGSVRGPVRGEPVKV